MYRMTVGLSSFKWLRAILLTSLLWWSAGACGREVLAVPALSRDEQTLVNTAAEDSDIVVRANIVLVWPKYFMPRWYPEAQVSSPEQMADWLEKIYVLSREWLDFDPNATYAKRNNGVRIRLVFIHNVASDFIFGGVKRPFIGLRKLQGAGNEDWFGWLTHELSHDFQHENPAFALVKKDWGEAAADYQRYWLLRESGMPAAAQHWLEALRRADPRDRYRGGAWILFDYAQKNHLKTPSEFWGHLNGKDFERIFGRPHWRN